MGMVGQSLGLWLRDDDFVSTGTSRPSDFRDLGFPMDWPAVYRTSQTLKALIGKRGRCAAKRVSVVGLPSSSDCARVSGAVLRPLHSFANAVAVEQSSGFSIIRGWAIFEHLTTPDAYVAESFWWNALPEGGWIDFTPRPPGWPQLVLAEAAGDLADRKSELLSASSAELLTVLFAQRFGAAPQAAADVKIAVVATDELAQLREQLTTARAKADEACAQVRRLEAEAASLSCQLRGERPDDDKWLGSPTSSASIKPGSLVSVHGLKGAQDLNGQHATVQAYDEQKLRWKVQLKTGEARSILASNLELVDESKEDPELSTFGCEVLGNLPPRVGNLPYNLWPLVHSAFVRVQISDRLLARLNAQIDEILADSRSPSHAPFLQGEIKEGKQLTVVKPDDEYVEILLDAARKLSRAILQEELADLRHELDAVWTVHQMAGDYNPVHFHNNQRSHFGFSSFLHLQVPPQLNAARRSLANNNARGQHDGVTSFVWKTDAPLARENLELPGIVECDHGEGFLYVFPQWLQHWVWPFQGPGERRTIAANVAVVSRQDIA